MCDSSSLWQQFKPTLFDREPAAQADVSLTLLFFLSQVCVWTAGDRVKVDVGADSQIFQVTVAKCLSPWQRDV